MRMRHVFIALAAACALILFAAGSDPMPGDAKRTGFFRTPQAEVIAFHAPGPLTPAEARAVLDRVKAKPGTQTLALLYQGDTPAPAATLTTAANLGAALRLVQAFPFDGWTHRVVIDAQGARAFD